MKYQFLIAAIISCFIVNSVYAFDGHNGIRFDMSQKEVEAKGFVCNPPTEKREGVIAECQHMDMTGVAFGYPTKDYILQIGPKKKVIMIGADISGRFTTNDYISLLSKIQFLFPTKKEEFSYIEQGSFSRNEWRDKSNAAAVLFVYNDSVRIYFWSPEIYTSQKK